MPENVLRVLQDRLLWHRDRRNDDDRKNNDRVPPTFAPRIADGLAAAYAHCEAINRHYGKTYYFSTRFFPADLRPSVHALYAWVRYPDEWVDNPNGMPLNEQRDRLSEWREATNCAITTGTARHPVLLAWADASNRHAVPFEYMNDFIGAMAMDLTRDRYETLADLETYTWGSASVVGLMMCAIAGVTDTDAVPYASKLGLAMQLTNFLRDVGEDWRERKRIYLPLEDLRRFGVTEADIASGRLTDNFRALVRFEADRARAIYSESDGGFTYIPQRSRLPIRLARLLYARILDKIEANNGDVLSKRARVSTAEKLATLAVEWQKDRAGKL